MLECLMPFLTIALIAGATIAFFHLLDAVYDAIHPQQSRCPACGEESYLRIICGDCYYNKGIREKDLEGDV